MDWTYELPPDTQVLRTLRIKVSYPGKSSLPHVWQQWHIARSDATVYTAITLVDLEPEIPYGSTRSHK